MSKTSLIMGLSLSLFVHGLLLLPPKAGDAVPPISAEPPAPEARTTVTLEPPIQEQLAVEPPEKIELEPPEPEAAPPLEALQQVIEPPADVLPMDEPGEFSDAEGDDHLPELRLTWDGPGQLIEVARSLGLRILLIGAQNQPVGELDLAGELSVRRFDGRLEHFSNRVRAIPRDFFGPKPMKQAAESVRALWVLVPAAVDQQWIMVQKAALDARGLVGGDVSRMEARIRSQEDGYRLVVTNVATL